MESIFLYNTMTRRKERFIPIDSKNIRIYLCGPTVYDRAHIGNARNVIVFDVLFRLLRYIYGENHVTYVRNFTDIDDKINLQAKKTGRPISQITSETIDWFLKDMEALGNLKPNQMPRATEYVPQMIEMIEILMSKGHAYVEQGHVLFSVSSYREYGKLSGKSISDMIAGSRIEIAPYKKDPMDFVLWKPSGPDLPGWDSPWGRGRPGWHIECSAMSRDLLGKSFDVHGGGNDLMFPHHENEIAQSRCAYPKHSFARVWLHNEMLQVEGKKMSKSLGNFFSVRDLLNKGYPGEVIRFVFLSTHYGKPMDWSKNKVFAAEKTLRKWRTLIQGAEVVPIVPNHFLEILGDDINTPGAITLLHSLASQNKVEELKTCASLLGLLGDSQGEWAMIPDLSQFADNLLKEHKIAVETKNYTRVDELKSIYQAAGLEVRINKTGVELIPTAGFNIAHLEKLL